MRKDRILAAVLCGLIAVSFSGCRNQRKMASSENTKTAQTSSADTTSDTQTNGDNAAESSEKNITESEAESQQKSVEHGKTSSQNSNESVSKNIPKVTSKPVIEPPKQTESSKSENKPTEPEKTNPPENPQPPQEPTTTSFDVAEWVNFAKKYGTETLHLALDSTAVSCWDDPISANSRCIYLERDIKDALNWYKAQGMTAFWVWSQDLGGGEYQIYIGYA